MDEATFQSKPPSWHRRRARRAAIFWSGEKPEIGQKPVKPVPRPQPPARAFSEEETKDENSTD